MQDEPIVLVENGEILEDMMRKARFNLDNLLMLLRQKKYPNLHDVEFVILESNGYLSVIPKSYTCVRRIVPRQNGCIVAPIQITSIVVGTIAVYTTYFMWYTI